MIKKFILDEFSRNINEVIRAVLNFLFLFYKKTSHAPKVQKAPKAQKAQKRNQTKEQNATSEQK